jgi:ureidoglycolate hydrolase
MPRIHAEALTEARFAPFGRLLRLPAPASGRATIARDAVTLYGDLARIGDVGADVEFGLALLEPREPSMDNMERHVETAELLFAVKGAFVLPLAPAAAELPAPKEVRCFVVPEGQGCVLERATWHWAPYPMQGRCEVLVGFKAGTPANDMIIEPLAGGAVSIAWDP